MSNVNIHASKKANAEISAYRKALIRALNLSSKRGLAATVKSIQIIEQVISKTQNKIKKNDKYLEVNLYSRQVIAGIYLHRLKKWKKAIEHYNFIIKNAFFKNHAPNVAKWVVYEGAGIAYHIGNKYKLAIKNFLISFKIGKKIKKIKKGKGKSCLNSSAYNLALVYAKLNKVNNAAKYIKISLENTVSKLHRNIIKKQIKRESNFKPLLKHKIFRNAIN